MKADYELRHSLHGRQGSMWELQVDDRTRDILRAIVTEAGNSTAVAHIDVAAASVLNQQTMLVEDCFFNFSDGDFAVVGRLQREYAHRQITRADGTRLYVGYRSGTGTYGSSAAASILARLPEDFIHRINRDMAATVPAIDDYTRDWYLIPTPVNLLPIVIQGREAGDYLIQGIDFLAFEGYIAMVDDPAVALRPGMVKINSAYMRVAPANSFVLAASDMCRSQKWLAAYNRKTQSLEAFRRAAAEFAGLYVFSDADVVLSAFNVGGHSERDSGGRVYVMAAAGAVTIRYPHTALTVGQTVDAGYVICGRFEVVCSKRPGAEDANRIAFMRGPAAPICLNGILPVAGLTWSGIGDLPIDSVESDPESDKPHLRLRFDGSTSAKEKYWSFSALHERATGVFLYDELGEPSLPTSVDFWALLRTFYGSQLALAIASDHGPKINSLLWKFLFEHHPRSCNIIVSLDLGTASALTYGPVGEPLVDEHGNYIMAPADCVENLLTVNGNVLTLEGVPLTLTVC